MWAQHNSRCWSIFSSFSFICFKPLSLVYGILGKFRVLLYTYKFLSVRSLDCCVISVGNLTVGGTGKTPLVIALANWLQRQNKRVGVISRGYGRDDETQIIIVSDGKNVLADTNEAGDEPVLIAARCPGVPVVVGADRYAAGIELCDRFLCEVLILDDGFQHVSLKRNANLLLVDAESRFGNGCLLPLGPLREPAQSIYRATALIVTRASSTQNDNIASQLGFANVLRMPIGISRFLLGNFINLRTGDTFSLDTMRGQHCVAFCGIANPDSFLTMLQDAGLIIHEFMRFPDHWRYTSDDIKKILSGNEKHTSKIVMTTEKDGVKIRHLLTGAVDIFAARIELEWIRGQRSIEQHLMDVVNHG